MTSPKPMTPDGNVETWRRSGARPANYIEPYRLRQKPVTSKLTNEEHAALKARAEAKQIATTTLATLVLREYLAREIPSIAVDNFEDAVEVYGDQHEKM